MRPHLIAASLLITPLIMASQAYAQGVDSEDRAQPDGASREPRTVMLLMPGLTAALSMGHTRGDGVAGVLGGELSAVVFNLGGLLETPPGPITALGAYVDGVWDFSADALRVSAGPELAWMMFGLDGGYMMQRRAGQLKHGANARVFISLVYVALYARGGATFGEAPERMMELGLLLKLPVKLR